MEAQPSPPAELVQLLADMVAPDGYGVVVHEWPATGKGHARLEIIAHPDACAKCLLPKAMLSRMLMQALPEGIELDDGDLIYPSEMQITER